MFQNTFARSYLGSGLEAQKKVNRRPRTKPTPKAKPQTLLEGSWYLVTNYNCTYNCTYNHIRALQGLISTVISTGIIG